MAILKDITTIQGVTANYHKIMGVTVDVQLQSINVKLAMFATQATRDAGCTPLWVEQVQIPFSDFTTSPMQLFYTALEETGRSPVKGGSSDVEVTSTDFSITAAALEVPVDPGAQA